MHAHLAIGQYQRNNNRKFGKSEILVVNTVLHHHTIRNIAFRLGPRFSCSCCCSSSYSWPLLCICTTIRSMPNACAFPGSKRPGPPPKTISHIRAEMNRTHGPHFTCNTRAYTKTKNKLYTAKFVMNLCVFRIYLLPFWQILSPPPASWKLCASASGCVCVCVSVRFHSGMLDIHVQPISLGPSIFAHSPCFAVTSVCCALYCLFEAGKYFRNYSGVHCSDITSGTSVRWSQSLCSSLSFCASSHFFQASPCLLQFKRSASEWNYSPSTGTSARTLTHSMEPYLENSKHCQTLYLIYSIRCGVAVMTDGVLCVYCCT